MIKTGKELAVAAESVAKNYKTLYVLGAFGWPMTEEKKQRCKKAQSYNRRTDRSVKIDAATADTFGFDCVCLIKALLWGWNGDVNAQYGGSKYQSNGVPDIDDSQMIKACADVSTDFSNIQVGEAVWMQGHIGVYIGNGLAVECTPKWADGVQITAVHNIGTKSGYNGRSWTKHGKLPYVTYEVEQEKTTDNKKGDYTMEMRNLYEGCVGGDVRALQILLKGNGYELGTAGPKKDGIDGDFGSKTRAAVVAFQVAHNLEADGIAGQKTMSKLMGIE